ncbi:MAG: GNAT family N-acetyltransferase [bacterium]|nr:GNAT family N-acetyltransferase [bacterium]
MRQSAERDMLEALELFYYASGFAKRRFLCVFQEPQWVSEMLLDLRLLRQAGLEVLLWAPGLVESDLPAGFPVAWLKGPGALGEALAAGSLPLLTEAHNEPLEHAFELARAYGAGRIIWFGEDAGLTRGGKLVSHLDLAELRQLIAEEVAHNQNQAFLTQMAQHLADEGGEWVFVQARAGALFQEIFTHQGSGTLVAQEYQKAIEPAQAADLMDLMLLMRPYVKSGVILPVDEHQLAKEVGDYWVYRLDGNIVATARTRIIGDWVELGKFCSLPRYQGKGRARELVGQIGEAMRAQGMRWVFALTIEPKMAQFFVRLGFEPVAREELPAQWAAGYDFSRPSTAFRLDLQAK